MEGPALSGPVYSTQLSDFNMHGSYCNTGEGLQYRYQLQKDHGTSHGHWQQLRPGHHHGPGGSTSHPEQYGPNNSMTFVHQMDSGGCSDCRASVWPSVVTETMGINTDCDCGGATDPHQPVPNHLCFLSSTYLHST